MAPHNITVVFVPGAWHSPDGFNGVIDHLHKAGYKTSKVYTPSVVRDGAAQVETVDADVVEVRKHLKEATDAGQKVIVVMHSYGGSCGSEAVRGFDQTTMAAQGHKDGRGVIHLMYLAAFILGEGESLAQARRTVVLELREDGTTFPIEPVRQFYNDFESKEEVDRWVRELRPMTPTVYALEIQYAPWKAIPTTYLICELDEAIPVDWQQEMVSNVITARASDLRVLTWRCGHTPFGKKPLEVSQLIRSAVGDVVN